MITLLFGAVAIYLLWQGHQRGFFRLSGRSSWNLGLRLWHVGVAFLLYFAISFIASPILQQILQVPPPFFASWFVFLNSACIGAGLISFCGLLPRRTAFLIWRAEEAKQSYWQDIGMAIAAWCIAFPLVLLLSAILEWLVLALSGMPQLPEQVAVQFVRNTFQSPVSLLLSILSISILAPLIEELLFRGFLQSFIRKHLGSHQAIGITSLCFSLFHYSQNQGWGNIPIIGSLFALALFLGFIYERQKSLAASISLHALFNSISIFNLYFFGEVPRGSL